MRKIFSFLFMLGFLLGCTEQTATQPAATVELVEVPYVEYGSWPMIPPLPNTEIDGWLKKLPEGGVLCFGSLISVRTGMYKEEDAYHCLEKDGTPLAHPLFFRGCSKLRCFYLEENREQGAE